MNLNLTLRWDGETGDGKAAFVVADQNDGWNDLRIELETDDVNSDFARAAMQEVIDRVNRANQPESANGTQETKPMFCADCKWFHRVSQCNGRCCRYPPKLPNFRDPECAVNTGFFPVVPDDCFCGEFSPLDSGSVSW